MKYLLFAIVAYFVIGYIYGQVPHRPRPCETARQETINWPFWVADALERYAPGKKPCPKPPSAQPAALDLSKFRDQHADIDLESIRKTAFEGYQKIEALCLDNKTATPQLVVDACTRVLNRGRYNNVSGLGYKDGMRPAILVRRGDAYLAQAGDGMERLAVQDYANAIENDPDYADAYRAKVRVNAHIRTPPIAISRIPDLKQLARLEPKNSTVLLDLALSQGILGNWLPAFDAVNRVLAFDPKPFPYTVRAALSLAQNKTNPARADFERALEIDPEFAAAHAGRALVASALEDVPSMIEEFTRAVTLNPRNGDYALLRGGAYLWAKDNTAALSDLFNAVSLLPEEPAAYEWRALAFSRLGKPKDAEADCARMLEFDVKSEVCPINAKPGDKRPGTELFRKRFNNVRAIWPSLIDIPKNGL